MKRLVLLIVGIVFSIFMAGFIGWNIGKVEHLAPVRTYSVRDYHIATDYPEGYWLPYNQTRYFEDGTVVTIDYMNTERFRKQTTCSNTAGNETGTKVYFGTK